MYSTAMAVERLKMVSTAMAVERFNNVAVELQSGCRKKSGCRKTGNPKLLTEHFFVRGSVTLFHSTKKNEYKP